MLKVIVAGGRDFDDKTQLYHALSTLFANPDCAMGMPVDGLRIVSGVARGADSLGEQWAVTNWVPVDEFAADWDTHGKSAGYIRNEEMARYADVLVAFWDGKSRGTDSMIRLARKYRLETHIYYYGDENE